MTAATKAQARDLEADLAICEAATPGPWDADLLYGLFHAAFGQALRADCEFAAEARQGWAYAIRRALDAETEVDKLRNELNILQQQVHGSEVYEP